MPITPIGPPPSFCVGDDYELVVTVHPNLVANAGPDQWINSGTSTFLSGIGTIGGTGELDYQWTNVPIVSGQGGPTPTTDVLYPPDLTVNLLVTDEKGCEDEDEMIIYFQPNSNLQVFVIADDEQICLGSSCQLTATASGGTQSYTYEWSPITGSNDPTQCNSNRNTC